MDEELSLACKGYVPANKQWAGENKGLCVWPLYLAGEAGIT